MNYVQVVGRYDSKPVVIDGATAKEYASIGVKVKSNFREADGYFRYDTFNVVLWKGFNREIIERAKLNCLLGIKGRLEIKNNELTIIAEHVEFLESY